MYKLLIALSILSATAFAETNSKGFEASSVFSRLRFKYAFQPVTAVPNPLYRFLSSASIGDVTLFRDGTQCVTAGSLHNLTYLKNGDMYGNIELKQEGFCRLPGQTDDQLKEILVQRYQTYFKDIAGLEITVIM